VRSLTESGQYAEGGAKAPTLTLTSHPLTPIPIEGRAKALNEELAGLKKRLRGEQHDRKGLQGERFHAISTLIQRYLTRIDAILTLIRRYFNAI